ncbi:LuxR family transcriptional regulator [Pseudomonas sp. Fl5BN2]|uniref:response regulator transcription factor n=1 Tax=unclassified Pseudomonas TaxID=196821 RepID=UPI001377EA96|nr:MULTISPECIES: LuxR C-terminal-related transcriptional regulator [unclassified Pseudomonas]NBF04016.1 LuxR family transcriptional regulator [Pseudomonas sp. Fl5BN2]NBF09737.1 LuxR family transcriptional regulator [Pseudomonas sp. Fl4BN1]
MNPPSNPLVAPLTLQSLQAWHTGLSKAFNTVDDGIFLRHLATALTALTPIESMMISLERKGLPPQLLFEQGIVGEYRDEIINRYFSRGYLLDPFCLAVENGLAEGFYHLSEIAPDDFFSSEYYKTYYLKTGGAEDCYYIVDLDPQSKISLCMFQGLSGECFACDPLALLRAVEPLVRELIRRFGTADGLQQLFRQATQGTPLVLAPANLNQQIEAAFMSFGTPLLTAREREIAHLILRGHSVKSTAKVLEISPETVRMHRKNLYTKLEISSQAELFALFIDWLTHSRSPADD